MDRGALWAIVYGVTKSSDMTERLYFLPNNEAYPFPFTCMHAQSLSHVQLFETPWTIAHQVPLSMGFSGQEYWSGLSCPPPGHLLTQG